MTSALNDLSIERPETPTLGWVLPSIIVLLLAVGAVAGLVAGLASPDVIGADGMAGTRLGTP